MMAGSRLLWSPLLAFGLAHLAGCSASTDSVEQHPGAVVLVRSDQPIVLGDTVFDIGRFGAAEEPLGEARGLIALGDGRIALVDASLPALIVLDPRLPEQSERFGRGGEGPGEFRAPRLIQAIGRDTLIVFDAATRSIQVFSRSGGHLSSVDLPQGDGIVVDPLGYVGKGLIMRLDRHSSPPSGSGPRTVESRIVIDQSGWSDTMAALPGGIISPRGFMFFAWRAVAALHGDHLWYGQGNRARISRLNVATRSEPETFSWIQPGRATGESDRQAMMKLAASLNAPPDMITPDRFADSIPLYSRIIPISGHRIALVGYEPPEGWADSLLVLDIVEKKVFPMALPEGFRPGWMSDTLMIGVSLTAPDGPRLVGLRVIFP